MFRKGHTGMIKVKRATEDTPGTLEIKVRINGNAANTGNVKDLKQLSGLHSHNSCMALQLCCKHMHPASQNLAVPEVLSKGAAH